MKRNINIQQQAIVELNLDLDIADMAIFPWLLRHDWQQINLADYPEVAKYIDRLNARPAVQKALAIQVS